MMRKIAAFALVASGSAKNAASMECQIDASGMVTDGMNSALNIWAAENRCQGKWLSVSPVKCTTDVASSIASVTHLASSIAGVMKDCGTVHLENAECGLHADKLVSATASLAAASAIVADKCGGASHAPWNGDVLGGATQLGKCTGNVGASINGIFQASNQLKRADHDCSVGRKCTFDTLDAVGVLANLGAAVAGAVGDCETYVNKNYDASEGDCAGAILSAIGSITAASDEGEAMKKACAAPSRLYSQSSAPATNSPALLALGAALPLTAAISFVLGKRLRARQEVEVELGMANSVE